MIESERQRQLITEDIQRWCDHVKATPLLRNGDIAGLVGTILGEFYHITLGCGHQVRDFDEATTLEFSEYDAESKGTVIGSYCLDCAKKYQKELGAWENGGY